MTEQLKERLSKNLSSMSKLDLFGGVEVDIQSVISDTKDTVRILDEIKDSVLSDIEKGRYESLIVVYDLKEYSEWPVPDFETIKNQKGIENVRNANTLRFLFLRIKDIISTIAETVETRINDPEVCNHFLPDRDCLEKVRNNIQRYREDLRKKKLERWCKQYKERIKSSRFIQDASKHNIIKEEAELDGTDTTEAAYRHFFREDEQGRIIADRNSLTEYILLYGCSQYSVLWEQYLLYSASWKLLQEIKATMGCIMSVQSNSSSENVARKEKKRRGRPTTTLEDCIVSDNKESVIAEIREGINRSKECTDALKFLYSLLNKGVLNDIPTYSSLEKHGIMKFARSTWYTSANSYKSFHLDRRSA